MAHLNPGGIKKKKGSDDITVPEFAMPPDAVPGIAQVIVNAWNGDASLSNILDRTNPGPQGVATPTAVQQATAAINAAAPGFNLKRAVIISEDEHDRDTRWKLRTTWSSCSQKKAAWAPEEIFLKRLSC